MGQIFKYNHRDTQGRFVSLKTGRAKDICPQCGKTYLRFATVRFQFDQSVCQACADENFAPTREKMQKIEGAYAEVELQRRINNEPTPEELERECHVPGPFLALSGAAT